MSSVTGLELPNAWRTTEPQDSNFDISANELNLTANRQLWIPTGTMDWQGALFTNAADPLSDQDLATKKYVDNSSGTGHVIQDETVALPQQPNLNFTGDLVAATDNNPNSATDVKIATGFSLKGDLLSYDGVAPIPLPVGTNGQFLQADSAETSGLKWVNAPSGTSPLTTKGDLYTFSTVDARLPVGTNGQVLSADSAETTGLKWVASGGGGGGEDINSIILEYLNSVPDVFTDYTTPSSSTATSEDGANVAANAIDGDIATFWKSNAGINESITVDMGSFQNCYGLAYYLDKTGTGITETQFQIKTPDTGGGDFVDDYSSNAGWTQVGTTVTVNDVSFPNIMKANVTPLDGTDRVHKALGFTLSDTAWVTEIEFQADTQTVGADSAIMAFTAGTGTIVSSTTIIMFYRNSGGTLSIELSSRVGGTFDASATNITITAGSKIYATLKRTSTTTTTIELFSDASRTVPIGTLQTLTHSSSVTGLNTVQHGSAGVGGASTFGTFEADNINVTNNSTTPAQPTMGKVLRTINVSDLAADDWNFIRFNGMNTQQLQIEGSSGNSLILAANELAVQVATDNESIINHGHLLISGTDPNLNLDGTP